MPVNNYPFQTTFHIPLPSPLLPIKVINPNNNFEYRTWGLIDTGAAESAIPEHIAKAVGHDVRSVKPVCGFGASGDMQVYPHSFKIDILDMDRKGQVRDEKIVYVITNKTMGVIKDLPFVLLGVKEFLNDFVLLVDYVHRNVSVKYPQNTHRTKNRIIINLSKR